MSFLDVRNGFIKLKSNFEAVSNKFRYWVDGQPMISFGVMEQELSGTLFFINSGGLLDEALEEYINVNFPTTAPSQIKNLNGKISFLDNQGKLTNAADLHNLRKKRNQFAHEPDKYGNWDDARWAIRVLETTFTDLGIL